jgi:hypothetical protein
MIDPTFAEHFAHAWIAAWNSRDLDRILSLYTDDFDFASPKIIDVVGEPSGMLKGKAAVGTYWAKGLQRLPNLHFELITVFAGINSMVIHYKNDRGMINAEMFEFGTEGLVCKSAANHAIEIK